MEFKPCKADHNLWMRDKGDHWEYIAIYVDDLLVFSKRPMEILDKIRETYDLKGVGASEYYLGSDYISSQKLKNVSSEDVKGIAYVGHSEKDKCLDPIWIKHGITTAFSARTYIFYTVDRLETMVGKQFGRYDTPMSEALHPEIDNTSFLNPIKHS